MELPIVAYDSDSCAETVLDSESDGPAAGAALAETGLDDGAEEEMAEEEMAEVESWTRRAEEEMAEMEMADTLLPVRQADVTPDETRRVAMMAEPSHGAPLTVRSSGLEAARGAERARRSAATSLEWELRTGGAVRAWLPQIEQDRRRTFSYILCPDICGDSEMCFLFYNEACSSFHITFCYTIYICIIYDIYI